MDVCFGLIWTNLAKEHRSLHHVWTQTGSRNFEFKNDTEIMWIQWLVLDSYLRSNYSFSSQFLHDFSWECMELSDAC